MYKQKIQLTIFWYVRIFFYKNFMQNTDNPAYTKIHMYMTAIFSKISSLPLDAEISIVCCCTRITTPHINFIIFILFTPEILSFYIKFQNRLLRSTMTIEHYQETSYCFWCFKKMIKKHDNMFEVYYKQCTNGWRIIFHIQAHTCWMCVRKFSTVYHANVT